MENSIIKFHPYRIEQEEVPSIAQNYIAKLRKSVAGTSSCGASSAFLSLRKKED